MLTYEDGLYKAMHLLQAQMKSYDLSLHAHKYKQYACEDAITAIRAELATHRLESPAPIRFFARIRSADLGCPVCGYTVRLSVYRKRRALRHEGYDPRTNQWRCPCCERAYIIGVILWTIRSHKVPTLPVDQAPTMDQLRQLRARKLGEWTAGARKSAHRATETNVVREGEDPE